MKKFFGTLLIALTLLTTGGVLMVPQKTDAQLIPPPIGTTLTTEARRAISEAQQNLTKASNSSQQASVFIEDIVAKTPDVNWLSFLTPWSGVAEARRILTERLTDVEAKNIFQEMLVKEQERIIGIQTQMNRAITLGDSETVLRLNNELKGATSRLVTTSQNLGNLSRGEAVSGTFSDPAKNNESCVLLISYVVDTVCLDNTVKGAFNVVLQIFAFILWASGQLFEKIFTFSIVEISDRLSSDAITETWQTARDFANVFFIFILLFAAINFVLGKSSEGKKMVTGVLFIAVIINFSLFFTKIVVDISNSFTVAIYNQALDETGQTNLSSALAHSLKITSIYGVKPVQGDPSANLNAAGAGAGVGKGSPLDLFSQSIGGALIIMIGGSAFFAITAFVLFVMAFMLLTRLVVIFFLMIISPLAFATSMLPGNNNQFEKWMRSLMSQAVFAPLFMLLFYFTLKITANLGVSETDGFAQALSGGDFNIIMNFAIIIIFMIASLIIAKQVATESGGLTAKGFAIGDKVRGWTQGRMGRGAVRGLGINRLDQAFKDSRFGNTRIGSSIRSVTTGSLVKQKFGSSASVSSIDKDDSKRREKYAELVQKNLEKKAEKQYDQNIQKAQADRANLVRSETEIDRQLEEVYTKDAAVQAARNKEETLKTDLQQHQDVIKLKEEEVAKASFLEKPQKERELNQLKQDEKNKQQSLDTAKQDKEKEELRAGGNLVNIKKEIEKKRLEAEKKEAEIKKKSKDEYKKEELEKEADRQEKGASRTRRFVYGKNDRDEVVKTLRDAAKGKKKKGKTTASDDIDVDSMSQDELDKLQQKINNRP